MTTALIYLLVMVLVAAVVFLLATVVFGRGEQLPPLPPGASPTRLPAEGVTSADLAEVRFQLVLRGYKMSEVDWVLHRLCGELDQLRARIGELEHQLADPTGDESLLGNPPQSRPAVHADGSQGGGGADSSAIGDDDNATSRRVGAAQQVREGYPTGSKVDPS